MSETTKDIERRQRLKEWFQSDPEIWQDILDEGKQSIHNESVQLEARTCTNREWSSGFVSGSKLLLTMEEYLRKIWTAPKSIAKETQSRPVK
jgi:hypothetical protein